MRQTLTLIIISLFLTCSINSQDQLSPESSKKSGLVAYLTSVKTLTEFKMSTLVIDSGFKSRKADDMAKRKSILSQYNLLKLAVDKLINQLRPIYI